MSHQNINAIWTLLNILRIGLKSECFRRLNTPPLSSCTNDSFHARHFTSDLRSATQTMSGKPNIAFATNCHYTWVFGWCLRVRCSVLTIESLADVRVCTVQWNVAFNSRFIYRWWSVEDIIEGMKYQECYSSHVTLRNGRNPVDYDMMEWIYIMMRRRAYLHYLFANVVLYNVKLH